MVRIPCRSRRGGKGGTGADGAGQKHAPNERMPSTEASVTSFFQSMVGFYALEARPSRLSMELDGDGSPGFRAVISVDECKPNSAHREASRAPEVGSVYSLSKAVRNARVHTNEEATRLDILPLPGLRGTVLHRDWAKRRNANPKVIGHRPRNARVAVCPFSQLVTAYRRGRRARGRRDAVAARAVPLPSHSPAGR